MSNVSGIGDNITFRTSIAPGKPYYYINAYLDLTGLEVGQAPNNYIYYFNAENNFNYLSSSLHPEGPDAYPGFYPIDDNAVIGEVVVYTYPNPEYSYNGGDPSDLTFEIGGAYIPSVAETSLNPIDVWAGPTGNVPGGISGTEIVSSQICHYGKEPALPAQDGDYRRRYLALNVYVGQNLVAQNEGEVEKNVHIGQVKTVSRVVKSRGRAPKVVRDIPTGDVMTGGRIHVSMKVYPKFLA